MNLKDSKDKKSFPILQGTDGIRGTVALASDAEVAGMSSVDAFIQKGIITDEFVEIYTYSTILFLLSCDRITPGEAVIIGWDPRDKEGIFTTKAIDGIRKAGMTALVVGIVPTPCVPLTMLYKKAQCGIMITASHNPANQNGIKIFLPPFGIKLLPEDDARLSKIICRTPSHHLKTLPLRGEMVDFKEGATTLFTKFILNSQNSWIDNDKMLSSLILIIDSANGSYSHLASSIFNQLKVAQVIDCNNDSDKGNVNDDCGVVDFEDIQTIPGTMIEKPSERFFTNKTIQKLFSVGRENKEKILKKQVIVAAAVFDADGDRFYRLDYNPFSDSVIVQNGDITAAHQARYLSSLSPTLTKGSLYINTVESDPGTAQEAEKNGLCTKLTAVGDKWILWWTAVTVVQSIITHLEKHAKDTKHLPFVISLKEKAKALSVQETARLDTLRDLLLILESSTKADNKFYSLMKEVEKTLSNPFTTGFTIGNESSGHTITIGYLTMPGGECIPVFSGNGIKSAINTFVATNDLFYTMDLKEYFTFLHHPFPGGIKKTFYVYFSKKELVKKNTSSWNKLLQLVEKNIIDAFSGIEIKQIPFVDEPNLLYFELLDEEKLLKGAIFIRNSGTEEKTGITVSGDRKWEKKLLAAGEKIFSSLLIMLKDPGHPSVEQEHAILARLYPQTSCPVDELTKNKSAQEYLIKIMNTKEGLITSDERGISLTDRGKSYYEVLTKTL